MMTKKAVSINQTKIKREVKLWEPIAYNNNIKMEYE
jgi:hypothetical protein